MLFIWYLRETHDCVNNSHITLKAGKKKKNKNRTCIVALGKQHWKCILPSKFIFRWCKETLKENLYKSAAWIWSKGKTIVKTDKMIKRYILLAWGIKTEQLKLLKKRTVKTNSILKKDNFHKKHICNKDSIVYPVRSIHCQLKMKK